MTPLAQGLAIAFVSAVVTAFSHALLKSGDDKLAMRAWSSLLCSGVALPIALWSGPPPAGHLMLLTAFGLLGGVYQLVLVKSYDLSDFSTAYPVARGIVPVAMALGGVLLLGDRLSPIELGGILAITCGIIALALGKGMCRSGWGLAIVAGLLTIGYSLIAAVGIRETDDPLGFIAWLFVFDGLVVPIYMFLRFRGHMLPRLHSSFSIAWPSAAMGMFSYGTLTYAMRLAPVGPVSAIRELSVLVGLMLAGVMLKERLDRWRVGAAALIAAGGIAIVVR